MMTFILKTPTEIMTDLAFRIKSKRLELNLTQEGICSRSGVSLGSLKRFEATGQISLESLLKLAHAVGALSDFDTLFSSQKNRTSLFSLNTCSKKRQRGKLK
ncbi:MAG: helix-turn-helix transcriptional regulator [Alphaproteobacteria bacterium]|nr:helix-turn-helix transcriptional regulator [Alphaproteobacteria bacterium]